MHRPEHTLGHLSKFLAKGRYPGRHRGDQGRGLLVIMEAANHRDIVLEATDDQECCSIGILDLEVHRLDGPGG